MALPNRPDIDPSQYSANCQAALLLWSDWADDVDTAYAKETARVDRLQERRDEMKVQIDQFTQQVIDLQAQIITIQDELAQMTNRRDNWKQKYEELLVERNALLEELYAFRTPPDPPPVP